jgi:hypothetical protein
VVVDELVRPHRRQQILLADYIGGVLNQYEQGLGGFTREADRFPVFEKQARFGLQPKRTELEYLQGFEEYFTFI